MRWRNPAGAALALALSLGALACGDEPPPPEPVVRPIKMLTIGEGPEAKREYPGRVRAIQQADMAFEVSGRIVEFVYKEGDRADEGAILARLDPSDYENALEQALALEKNARTYLGRIAEVHKTGAASDQDLDDAQAKLEVSAAEVKIKQKALNDTQLRAPFDGVMARKLVEDFANVRAKETVLVFEDDSSLEIKVSIPERDLAGRRTEQQDRDAINERIRPVVTITSLPEHKFPARLRELATTADPTTRTFEATFHFDQIENISVLPGMTAKVTVTVAGPGGDSILIPARAVFADDDGQATVWIIEPDTNQAQPRPVSVGELTGESIVVIDGLQNGDVIAISGVTQLRPGMTVRRWEP